MSITRGKVLVNFEVWPHEREQIKEYAALHGLKMADYCRMRTLSDPIERETTTEGNDS